MTEIQTLLAGRPALARIAAAVLKSWPEHAPFLAQRFADPADPALPVAEEMAAVVLRLIGDDLPGYIASYRRMCEAFVAEDLHFRRTGRYRLSSFADAYREVYSRPEYMSDYLRGILLSQILWANQAESFRFYVENFLARLRPGSDLLEVGPGHGLLIYFAARAERVASITGWDVSESSLAMTRRTLETIGVTRPYALALHNILEPPSVEAAFDAVVVSEVLEHLDRPTAALDTVFAALRPGGRAFFNVPVNSPAPDHIYHWRSPAEVEEMVASRGFALVDTAAAATTGYDLERALRRKVTVNALIVAGRP
ncbi:MAG: class I SAM-dependent methyltransferase [Proteobacteria bacterium]|nr:class I SAM-dependent methyltransferase [Pseudomonadota bacterium]